MIDSLELSKVIYPEEPACQVVEAHALAKFIEINGGRFLSSIASAWWYADPINRAKIETTWAAEWEKFRAAMEWKAEGEKRRRSVWTKGVTE